RHRLWLVPLNAVLVLAGVAAAGRVHDALHRITYPLVTPAPPYLNDSGRVIENIYPFSVDGQPLRHVLLYDQAGTPIANVAPSSGYVYPRDRDGNPILNEYPIPNLLQAAKPDGSPTVTTAPAPTVVVPPRAVSVKPVRKARRQR
ncbi:MAG: hypothetical protein QOE29_2412, partial [Gaiellaceae bacterium]|nr:hypothetical protein [Gaiellaceae bacterium]